MATATQPEQVIGVWRASKWSPAFWLRALFTLGLYWLLVHRFNEIKLSTRRVTQVRGNILTQNETAMSLENITDVTVNRSMLGRLLGYGDISIQTAGSGATEIQFKRMQSPDRLREMIFDLRDGKLDEVIKPKNG